jgi:hypothetical protein
MMTTEQDPRHTAIGALEVSVFRFSAQPGLTADFLELLGLSSRVSNAAGTWYELQGEHGVVNLHGAGAASTTDAEPGSTGLVLIARDVTAFAAAVEGIDGLEVDVWDEAFGRQAIVTHRGRKITINEMQVDPYGYQIQQPTPGPVTVVSHCHGSDLEQLRDLLVALGFRPVGSDTPDGSSRLESDHATGVVLLHPQDAEAGDRCDLGLETSDDLGVLAERLRAAGHEPRLAPDAQRVEIVDPDGQLVLITARR